MSHFYGAWQYVCHAKNGTEDHFINSSPLLRNFQEFKMKRRCSKKVMNDQNLPKSYLLNLNFIQTGNFSCITFHKPKQDM